MKNNHPIVLVKRKKGKKHLVAQSSWKIAYADFMTAMMAFFMMMWLISIADPQQLVQIADYFRTPLKVALAGGSRSSDSESPIPGGGQDPIEKLGEVSKVIDMEAQKRKLDEIRLNRLHEKLDQLIEADPRLRALRQHLIINMVEQGLRIQIIDSQNRPMFKTGSAEVEPYMRDILRGIAPILNDIPNRISLAGHTDDSLYAEGDRGYSNWELSTDRANASRRELIAGGLDSDKMLRIVGMAATMKLTNRGADDAVNRRISLLILNHDTEEQIEHENSESDAVQIKDIDSLKQIAVPGLPAAEGVKPDAQHPQTAPVQNPQTAPAQHPQTAPAQHPQTAPAQHPQTAAPAQHPQAKSVGSSQPVTSLPAAPTPAVHSARDAKQ